MNFEEPPMSQVGWAVVYDVSPTRVNLAKILGKVAALEWPGCPTAKCVGEPDHLKSVKRA